MTIFSEKSRRILSLASGPQPVPEPESFTQFARIDEGEDSK
jgi:hypothetical protein